MLKTDHKMKSLYLHVIPTNMNKWLLFHPFLKNTEVTVLRSLILGGINPGNW